MPLTYQFALLRIAGAKVMATSPSLEIIETLETYNEWKDAAAVFHCENSLLMVVHPGSGKT